MGVSQAQQLFSSMTQDVSVLFIYLFGILLGICAAVLGLYFGLDRMLHWIYNEGGSMRGFGTLRWKGYNRFRSEKWNMEHTL